MIVIIENLNARGWPAVTECVVLLAGCMELTSMPYTLLVVIIKGEAIIICLQSFFPHL